MSHYVYQPLTGKFKSNADVTLSLEEMRWEYYVEMEHKRSLINEKVENRKRHYESDCEQSSFPIIKRKKIMGRSPNRFSNINDEMESLSRSILSSPFQKSRKLKTLKSTKKTNLKNIADEERHINVITEMRKLGNDFIKKGNYEEAYKQYSKALALSTESNKYPHLSVLNYSNRAWSLLKLERPKDALQDCDSALTLNSKDLKTRLRRIKCLIALNRFEEAKVDVLELKSVSESFDPAINEYEEFLTIISEKQEFSRLVEKGYQMETARNYEAAIQYYTEAKKIDSSSAELCENRGRVYFQLSRFRESLDDLNESLRLNPINSRSMYNRIGCLIKLERFQEAIRDAEQLNKVFPTASHSELLHNAIDAEKRANKRNFYEILGVDRNCTLADIKKKYRKLALLYHPDKLADIDPHCKRLHEEKFKKLNLILETLSDPIKRRMYDLEIF